MDERSATRPNPDPVKRRKRQILVKGGAALVLLCFFLAALLFVPLFIWFFCRIEPGADQIAVLIRKTGSDLPPGQIVATGPDQKGIQLEVLPEGRYFRNPYTWSWRIARIVDIPAGKLGIVTRLYGQDLPAPEILARDGTKGILPDALGPGKYRLNPYAYSVHLFNATDIRPGHVGVVTTLTGSDVLNAEDLPGEANTMLVAEGMKGVSAEVLDPGTYYLHPFLVSVAEVNLQSQRFEMSGTDIISFLTMDGFTVSVEGTIEYALQRDKAALLTHRVGDMEDIIKKIILPRARGFSRIEGSKHPAIDFIVGETRQRFQSDLEAHLREKCRDWGVDIHSVLVRKIAVPDQIASISREQEMAVQEARKYERQIEQARSEAELVKQEMLAAQNKEKVEADTRRIRAVINAEQQQAVRLVSARKELEVAKLENEAARYEADAVRLKAGGERDAILKRTEAEAAVARARIGALGSGMAYSRYLFYQRLAPRIEGILGNDGPDGLGSILRAYAPEMKEMTR